MKPFIVHNVTVDRAFLGSLEPAVARMNGSCGNWLEVYCGANGTYMVIADADGPQGAVSPRLLITDASYGSALMYCALILNDEDKAEREGYN